MLIIPNVRSTFVTKPTNLEIKLTQNNTTVTYNLPKRSFIFVCATVTPYVKSSSKLENFEPPNIGESLAVDAIFLEFVFSNTKVPFNFLWEHNIKLDADWTIVKIANQSKMLLKASFFLRIRTKLMIGQYRKISSNQTKFYKYFL